MNGERRTLNAKTVVLKLGGELLDNASDMKAITVAITKLAAERPVVVIHGGGRAIDAELRARGLEPQFVDGLRVTDAAALDVVVSVLAGRNNTALVAALGAAGCRAVGLTGADAAIGLAMKAPAFNSVAGEEVDLGLVGQPSAAPTALLVDLLDLGYVPVIASIGVSETGELLNVNADTLAGHLAGALRARQLVIAGGTAGVLDADGNGIAELTLQQIDELIGSRQAHSGMVAKLAACRVALTSGVPEVAIVSGRDVADWSAAKGTRLTVETATV